VIFPAAGSVQRPSRMRASWSRPKLSAEVFVSKPDSLILAVRRAALDPPRARASAALLGVGHGLGSAARPALPAGDGLPGAGLHDAGDIGVAESQVLADECAWDLPFGGL
jgi:hypothetical protein